jgi:hypothetical protein
MCEKEHEMTILLLLAAVAAYLAYSVPAILRSVPRSNDDFQI